jgi:hypothetical protein
MIAISILSSINFIADAKSYVENDAATKLVMSDPKTDQIKIRAYNKLSTFYIFLQVQYFPSIPSL